MSTAKTNEGDNTRAKEESNPDKFQASEEPPMDSARGLTSVFAAAGFWYGE
jgi:hypothetical protein